MEPLTFSFNLYFSRLVSSSIPLKHIKRVTTASDKSSFEKNVTGYQQGWFSWFHLEGEGRQKAAMPWAQGGRQCRNRQWDFSLFEDNGKWKLPTVLSATLKPDSPNAREGHCMHTQNSKGKRTDIRKHKWKNLTSVYILIHESVPSTEDILQSSFSTFTAKRWW